MLGEVARGWHARRRVARVLEALRDPAADPRPAAPERVSPAHLRALFVHDVGLPPVSL
ncbi:hypothetical protein [Sorangium sp. So ce861]|uniref:hypothetical protein n=1 Tax=Sorangium sp. So ce861 TaxID=3133323 RepID=UPI003F60E1D3